MFHNHSNWSALDGAPPQREGLPRDNRYFCMHDTEGMTLAMVNAEARWKLSQAAVHNLTQVGVESTGVEEDMSTLINRFLNGHTEDESFGLYPISYEVDMYLFEKAFLEWEYENKPVYKKEDDAFFINGRYLQIKDYLHHMLLFIGAAKAGDVALSS